MGAMTTHDDNPDGWRRVAVAIEQRAIALGWTLTRLYEEADISETTFLAMRKRGHPIKKPAKVAGLERGLGWELGSVGLVLAGGEPVVSEQPPEDEVLRRLARIEALAESLLQGQEDAFAGLKALLRQRLPRPGAVQRPQKRAAP